MTTTIDRLTQYKIGEQCNSATAQDILEHYRVAEHDLFRLFAAFEELVKSNGINVEIVDLSTVQDSDTDDTDHAETCTADGKTIYLHNQLKDHGGILTRIYDIMHMGCGHLIQRGANEKSGINRYGDKAREIGSVFHGGANEDTLKEVEDYEFEAGKMGVSYMKKLLDTIALDSDPADIIQLYSDYVRTDKTYIIDYYRTQQSKHFFSTRQYFQPLIDEIQVPIKFTPQQRTQIQIGLIRTDG